MKRGGAFCICVIGNNGEGKTTYIRKRIIAWKRGHPNGKVIIHDYRDDYADLADEFIDSEDEHWALRYADRRNILLVLDEFKIIHDLPTKTKGDKRLRANFDENGIDIILAVHSPPELVNYYGQFTQFYIVFYTKHTSAKLSDKFPEYDRLNKAIKLVNNYRTRFGKNEYPHFTRIDVPIEGNKVKLINFDDDKLEQLKKR